MTITIEINNNDNALGWALFVLGQPRPSTEDGPTEASEGWDLAAGNSALKSVRSVFLPDHQDPDDPAFVINVTVNDQNVVATSVGDE